MATASQGETSLRTLLSTLTLTLGPTVYVFITVPAGTSLPLPLEACVLLFREAEGTTIIASLEDAERRHLTHQYRCRMITCAVHSSLEAVGFLAVLTRELAAAGISCNPVSAYFHDHLFVPEGREAEALAVLETVVRDARAAAGLAQS